MLYDAQEEFTKEAVHLQGLSLVQFNLAEQFHLFLAQVSFLWTMILTVVATTHHSRTNDLTMSKALQWAIK